MANYKKLLFLFFLIFSSLSCGKKVDDSDKNSQDRKPENSNELGETMRRFMQKQDATCEDEFYCNESVARIVILGRDKIRYCSGALISPDTMVTSGSCLIKSLKVPGIDCQNHLLAVFPKTYFKPQFKVLCDKILSANINDDDVDPALWRNDFAFIKLKEEVPRQALEISRYGIEEKGHYHTWKVNYESDEEGTLQKRTCYPIFNSYANPFAERATSPMIPVSDCEYTEGNSGAPLMNDRGEIVGVFSGELDKKVGTFILNSDVLLENMAPIHHVSNLHCAKLPFEKKTFNYGQECFKQINVNILDRYRAKILNSIAIHQEHMKEIEEELEAPDKYFLWDIKFYANDKGNVFEAHFSRPKCFFDIKSWIGEFTRWGGRVRTYGRIDVTIPQYRLYTKLDRVLRPISYVESLKTKDLRIEFNPKYALTFQNTFVNISGNLHGNYQLDKYSDVTDACP